MARSKAFKGVAVIAEMKSIKSKLNHKILKWQVKLRH